MDNYFQKNSNKKGLFILIWFLIGFFGAIITAFINPSFTVMFIGEIFLLVPVLFITGDMKRSFSNGAISLFCFFVSALFLFLGWVNVFGSNELRVKVEEKYPLLFSLLFFFLGLGIIITHLVNNILKKKRCTHIVNATVIGLKPHRDSNDDTTTYSPIYQFWFNGNEYTVTTSSSRNFALPKIGSQKDIYINPQSPTDFYSPAISDTLLILLFGFLVIYFSSNEIVDYFTSI